MGDVATRKLFAGLIVASFVAIVVTSFTAGPYALLGLVGVIALRPAIDSVARGAKGRDLIAVLGAVGKGQLVLGITYTAGLVLALGAT